MTMDEFNDQIMPAVRKALAASGPVSVMLIHAGWPEANVSLWLDLAIAVIPLIVSIVWGAPHHTVAGKVATAESLPEATRLIVASQVRGATVVTGPMASLAVKEVAHDDNVPGVITEKEFFAQKLVQ